MTDNAIVAASPAFELRDGQLKRAKQPYRGRPKGRVLKRWMMLYADWELFLPYKPTIAQRVEAATKFAGRPISDGHLRNMKSVHMAYRAYCDTIRESNWFGAAKQKAELLLPTAMDLYHEVIAISAAKLDAKDPEEVSNGDLMVALKATEPLLDRVLPKKEAAPIAAVQIVLSTQQQAALFAPPDETVVEAEILDDPV